MSEPDIAKEEVPQVNYQSCRRCGDPWLVWGRHKGKWRLFDEDGSLHRCPVKPLRDHKR